MIVYLLDKSALASHLPPTARSRIQNLVIRGQIAVCEMTQLEILYSAESPGQWLAMQAELQAYRLISVGPRCWDRAIEVQGRLAERGQHRRPLPDLIVAATASVHGLTVLHNDKDFEIIAEVTGQPTERITS